MKKLCLAISLLYGTTLLNGCAVTPPDAQAWKVEPFQTIRHATNKPDGYYQLGRYYQGQNRLTLAAEAYQKALAIDPDFTEAHNGLGTIYAAEGKYEQAHKAFKAAIATAPDTARLYNNLGYLNFLEGHHAEAVAAFTKATDLDPANQKAWNNLGMALAKNGEPIKANQAFAQAKQGSATNIAENTAQAPKSGAALTTQAPANETLNQVAAGNDVTSAPTLTIPKDRGVIVYPTAVKSEHNAEPAGLSNKQENQSIQLAKLVQPITPPPFAVVAEPNPKAMPGIVISGDTTAPSSHEIKAQPKLVEQKIAAAPAFVVTTVAATMKSSEKFASKPQLILASSLSAPTAGKHSFKLMVSNGNGIECMAAKFGALLSSIGFPKASLTNQKPFNQTHTVIQYEKGYLTEATRLSYLLKDIKRKTILSENNGLPSNINVRLVLGKDLSNKEIQTYLAQRAKPITLASR